MQMLGVQLLSGGIGARLERCKHAERLRWVAAPTARCTLRAEARSPSRLSATGARAEPLEPGTQMWEMEDGAFVGDDEPQDAAEAVGPERRAPAEVRAFDRARINVKAGDGGNGAVAFLREKFRPNGGPAGGNGGKGGDVWAVADDSANSLLSFRRKVHFRAEDGLRGGGKSMHGETGADIEVPFPPGTIIRLPGAPAPIEILPGDRKLLLRGGAGGRGNASFKTGKNRAPQLCEHGEAGPEAWLDVELKLVADVGIVGVPNAGKSTLLSVVSAAKPKIADYPFTTLVPNLGVCTLDFASTVFADIPGLLEGAHTGLGLGLEFLRHTERCRLLVHVLDGAGMDPAGDYEAINTELRLFNPAVADKPQVVALNKCDLPHAAARLAEVQAAVAAAHPGTIVLPLSAATSAGVVDLVREVHRRLAELPPRQAPEPAAPNVIEGGGALPGLAPVAGRLPFEQFEVEGPIAVKGGGREWVVWGEALERLAQMTNWEYYESTTRFQRVLDLCGVTRALRRAGAREGDSIAIGNSMEFDWVEDEDKGRAYERWLQGARQTKGGTRWPHGG